MGFLTFLGSTPSCTRADSVTVADYVFPTPNTAEALCNRDLAGVHTITDTQRGTAWTDTQSGDTMTDSLGLDVDRKTIFKSILVKRR